MEHGGGRATGARRVAVYEEVTVVSRSRPHAFAKFRADAELDIEAAAAQQKAMAATVRRG